MVANNLEDTPRGFSREWPAKPKTEDEELSELKTLGIGMKSAMVVTKGLARLRAKALEPRENRTWPAPAGEAGWSGQRGECIV